MLVGFISFLGLVAGIIITHFTFEELKPGKIYFKLIQIATAFGIFVLFGINFSWFVIIFLIVGIPISLVHLKKNISYILFPLFAILLVLRPDLNLNILIFIYGVSTATLICTPIFGKYNEIFIKVIVYHLPFFLPILIRELII